MLAEQRPVPAIAERLGVGRSTVYAWLSTICSAMPGPACRSANLLGGP
jgi:transposase-like protein